MENPEMVALYRARLGPRYQWQQMNRTGDRGDGLVTLVRHGIAARPLPPPTPTPRTPPLPPAPHPHPSAGRPGPDQRSASERGRPPGRGHRHASG